MPRWLVWLVSGLAVIGLGLLVVAVGYQEHVMGVVVAGWLIQAAGVWVVIVAAVVLGVRVATESMDRRLESVEARLPLTEPDPSPKELDHASAVTSYLTEHPGADLGAIAVGAGLTRGQVRAGLRVIDGSGRLRSAEGGYEIVDR